jgi:hypothetical protein
MVELRDHARFAFEAGTQFGIVGQMTRENLDRDGAIEAGVRGPVHLSHAALSELVYDLVVRKPSSDQLRFLPPSDRSRF